MSDMMLESGSSMMLVVSSVIVAAISKTIARTREQREKEWEEARRQWVLENTGRLPNDATFGERREAQWEYARAQWVLEHTGRRVAPATRAVIAVAAT